MTTSFIIVKDLFTNIALLTMFLFIYNHIVLKRYMNNLINIHYFRFFTSIFFSVYGILLMYYSVRSGTQSILDLRQLAIITATLIGGWLPGLITAISIILGRILLFGGYSHAILSSIVSAIGIWLTSAIIHQTNMSNNKKWIIASVLMLIELSIILLIIFGTSVKSLIFQFFLLSMVGVIFIAYLVKYFVEINTLENTLRDNEEKYRTLAHNKRAILSASTDVAIIATDMNGIIQTFNTGAQRILGYSEEEIIGKYTPVIFHDQAEMHQRAQEIEADTGKKVEGFSVFIEYAKKVTDDSENEWIFIAKNGEKIFVNLVITQIIDDVGILIGYLGVATDLTQRKNYERELLRINEELHLANEQLELLSTSDGLTNIPNRRHFNTVIETQWEMMKNTQEPLSLILFDIDYFKKYNDHYGHLQGDESLKQVAKVLKDSLLSKHYTCARFGGEEFAVILPNATSELVYKQAEIIRQNILALQQPHEKSTISPIITISLGAITLNQKNDYTLMQFIDACDSALYEAKNKGRNRTVVTKL